MNKTITYKGKEVKFFNLLEQEELCNMDGAVINGTLFQRPDHNMETLINVLKLQPGNIVYDIGAYIGTFSIPMAIEGMSVYAFEGFPDNFERARKNCEPYENIKIYGVAVHNKNEIVETKFNDCTDLPAEARTITYVKFDEFIEEKNIPLPDFVKMDIEGMETIALFEMTNLLENARPIWQIGYHEGLDIKFDDYPGFVKPEEGGFNFNKFKELDYEIFTSNGHRLPSFMGWGDYLCIPREKLKR